MRAMGHPVGEQRVRVGPREESVLAVSWRLTYPWNLLGLPAVTLAIANKTARTAWALLVKGESYRASPAI